MLSTTAYTAELIAVYDLSAHNIPDPSGIMYDSNEFIIVDSEVNETPLFSGVNVFRFNSKMELIESMYASYTDEPTGVSFDGDGACYISDDSGPKRIYKVDSGQDGECFTSDDVVSEMRTLAYDIPDPEGVFFGNGALIIAGGTDQKVTIIRDEVHSDLVLAGMTDVEGVALRNGTIYAVGSPREYVFKYDEFGQELGSIFLGLGIRKPSGVTFAPSTDGSLGVSMFVTARGVDNNYDPDENDGKIYEYKLDGCE
jgi:hypothetical protein